MPSLLSMVQAATSFSPASLPNMKLWLDFSDTSKITTVSGAISQIIDKSTNAYTFTQGTAGNRPTLQANVKNGLSVSRYDGSNDFVTGNMGADSNTFTIFILFNPSSLRQFNTLVTASVFGTGTISIEEGSGTQLDLWFSNVGARANTGTGTISTNNWFVATVSYTSGAGIFYINGTSRATTNQVNGFLEGTNMNIGYDGGLGFQAYAGDIGEIIMYSQVLTSTQVTQVYNYYRTKWAL